MTTRYEVEEQPDGSATISSVTSCPGWMFEQAFSLNVPAEHRAAVAAVLAPPAPAAITEAQIEAAAKAIYERQSWETRNHWDDLDDIERDEWIADAQVALAAAPAQSGGERNKE